MHYYLQCKVCKKEFAGNSGYYQCPQCGGKLEIKYISLPQVKHVFDIADPSKRGLWKYWRLLPIDNVGNGLSLGEGDTFLHYCEAIARMYGFRKLWLKDEGTNPTGSFKDRNACVSVTKAKELGAQRVAIASDANAGPSVAAYAAKAGLPCYVFMPTSTVVTRIAQASLFGANIIRIEAKGLVSDCIDLVENLKPYFNWHHLTTAGPVNPYQLEAPKTIAYEIAIDLDGAMPDWIVAPAGGGGLIVGLFKGFNELAQMGLINHVPKFCCVQSVSCAPIVKAFTEKTNIQKWEDPKPTVAVPIAVPLPLEGEEVLQVLQETDGVAISVTDEEILKTQKILAKTEGILASPTGVSALVGAIKAREQGFIREKDTVVVVITETGLKDLGQMATQLQVPTLPADIEVIKDFLLNVGEGGGKEGVKQTRGANR
jgi:threonine synthase